MAQLRWGDADLQALADVRVHELGRWAQVEMVDEGHRKAPEAFRGSGEIPPAGSWVSHDPA